MNKDRLLHNVTITVFQKPDDLALDILKGLDRISPVPMQTLLALDCEQDDERPQLVHHKMPDIELSVERLSGEGGSIIIYTLFFKRMAWVNKLARDLFSAMTAEQRSRYIAEPQRLLDPDGKLSMRVDKPALTSGKVALTERGNCYQVKAAVAAYPKNAERVLATIRRMLE